MYSSVPVCSCRLCSVFQKHEVQWHAGHYFGEAELKVGLSLPPRSTQGEVQHVSEGRHQCGRSGLVALGACLADVLPKKPFLVFVFVDLHVCHWFLFH